jgi:hypothetical protein
VTTTNGTVGEVLEGLVEAVRPTGVKVQGIWASVSQFHPVPLPDMGAHVRIEIDGKRFLRSVQVLAAPAIGHNSSTRDVAIARMCAIKVAANVIGQFAQTHEEVRTEHIFPLADRIYAWITQEGEHA